MNKNNLVYAAVVVVLVAIFVVVLKADDQTISGQVISGFCRDTDGGRNIRVSGRVNTNYGGFVKDNCIDKKILIEQYCSSQTGKSEKVDCVKLGYKKCDQRRCVN